MSNFAFLSYHTCPTAELGRETAGGMNVYINQVARELGSNGHSVDVFTRSHSSDVPEIEEIGPCSRVIHIDSGLHDAPKSELYDYVGQFTEGVKRFQNTTKTTYDLIYSHYWLSGISGIVLAEDWDVPHIAMFHTTARMKMSARIGEREPAHRGIVEGDIMEAADAIVVATAHERREMSHLYGISQSKVQVITPGVDVGLFRPTDRAKARRALGFGKENIILSVGRIEPLKGIDIILGAMALLDRIGDTRLVVVGGHLQHDPALKQLQATAQDLGLRDIVTFVGAVPQVELPLYYNAANIFVMPSYFESFGLVALEAMACGLPVIATRVGGPREFVKAGVTGYLIDWHCPEPFAQRLDMVLANPSLHARMAEAATHQASQMTWANTASDILGLYSSLVSNGHHGSG